MAKTYTVRYAFAARGKSGKRYWIDAKVGDRIRGILTDEQIAEHVKAGNLIDDEAENARLEAEAEELAAGLQVLPDPPAPAEPDATTRSSRRSGGSK